MAALPAHLVAVPVLERLGGERGGVVLGAGATAAWVEVDGFVVAVTTREVPLLPNAVAVAAGSGALSHPGVAAGTTARVGSGRVDLGPLRITWDPATPPAWDPAVPVAAAADPDAVAGRGAALLTALGVHPQPGAGLVRGLARVGLATAVDPDGADGLALLFRGVLQRDPVPAAAAARVLLGRGPGLTPEGDDLLAAVAGTVAVLGPATGLDRPGRDAFLAALAPVPGRTTALSATLLELAAHGRLAEPAGRLLDLDPPAEPAGQPRSPDPVAGPAWASALARLERLGHGSGRAYAVGIGVAATLLAAGSPGRSR